MLRLQCPFCGDRPETEFQCAGDATARPANPAELDEAAWADALYQRNNPAGWSVELWWHTSGCRQWLLVERNTVTHQVGAIRFAGASQ